jgi:hypothetical protein
VEPFQQSSFALSPKQSSSIMSGYGRGRLLLGSSSSESESEWNSDSRRRSDGSPRRGLSIHNQSEYQDYLDRRLNRPTPAAIENNTSSANVRTNK